MNDLGYVNMGTDEKFSKFVTTNYKPFTKRPVFDVESEFVVQVIFPGGTLAWYGPISFDDLSAFTQALPIEEMAAFIHRIKGNQDRRNTYNH
jgi:hypothetical protein